MTPRSVRVRTLFVLCGLAAATLVAAVAYAIGPTVLEVALAGALPPERVAEAVTALRSAFVASTLAALLLIVPISLGFGGIARRGIAELRAALSRRGGSVPEPTAVTDLNALAAAIGRVLEEHRRTLDTLGRERDDLALLIDSVGEGIVQVAGDGRCVRANRTAREMLGLPVVVAGVPIASLVRNAELRTMLLAACRGQDVEPADLPIDDRRLLVVAHPLAAAAGAVAVLVDLTVVHRLEAVRRDFVANASHELKTPLTSIRGYAETLASDDDLPAEMRRGFLETIQQNAVRLQHIVDDLLDLSRLESGGWRPDLQALDLARTAADVWEGLRGAAAAKRLAFQVEAGDATTVVADPVGARQILTNLLDNAIRYTPPGGRITVRIGRADPVAGLRPSIRRAAGPAHGGPIASGTAGLAAVRGPDREDGAGAPAAGGPWIVAEVVDTGIGIPGDALDRVFERFYRVDPARSRAGGGTGLGLSIVRHLVEAMGGDIRVESELGKGTAFRFRLPAAATTPQRERRSAHASA